MKTETQTIKLLLADDHAIVRDGLRSLIEQQTDMEIIGEAADGAEAVASACSLRPDVVVMDVSMPQVNGIEATRRIRKECPETRVLALTMHEDRTTLRQVLEAGASGYTLKRAAGQELLAAIRAVAADGVYLHPLVAGKVVGGYVRRGSGAEPTQQKDSDLLSEREREVVRLLAHGYSNKEVAAQLEISVKTVETYRARVGEKLGLQSRSEMVRYALAQGWLKEV
jgi:DNA-binding NarL/FixJ family response regulator